MKKIALTILLIVIAFFMFFIYERGIDGANTTNSMTEIREIIGTNGGTLNLPNGIQVMIPKGALPEDVYVALESRTKPTVAFNENAVEVLDDTLRISISTVGKNPKVVELDPENMFIVAFAKNAEGRNVENMSCRVDIFDDQKVSDWALHSVVGETKSGELACEVPFKNPGLIEVSLLSYDRYVDR